MLLTCVDLYGLVLFLGADPYWVKFWWNKLLFEPFIAGVKQPLYAAVSHVLWRTAKDDVIDQVTAFTVIAATYYHLILQGSLTDAKINTPQYIWAYSKEICSKFLCIEVEITIFNRCILIVDHYQRNSQQHQHSLFITEKVHLVCYNSEATVMV